VCSNFIAAGYWQLAAGYLQNRCWLLATGGWRPLKSLLAASNWLLAFFKILTDVLNLVFKWQFKGFYSPCLKMPAASASRLLGQQS
jgi:hypothetical protein